MGWCSATEIMDAAVSAAQQAVMAAVSAALHEAAIAAQVQAVSANVDRVAELMAKSDGFAEVMSPFVSKIAEQLRDGDWDCIDESAYFDRFPQEMLGYDDSEWEEWLVRRLADLEPPNREWTLAHLNKLYAKKAEEIDGTG